MKAIRTLPFFVTLGLVLGTVACNSTPLDGQTAGRSRSGLEVCEEGEECPGEPPACVAAPLALTPLDTAPLDPTVAAFDARCRNGSAWCTVAPVRAYTLPTCLAAEPTLDEIVTLALAQTAFQDQQRDFSYFQDFDRATLGAESYFSYYGPPGALDDVDGFAGPSIVVARGFVDELRCHNCHEFGVRYVIYYPESRKVVVVDGTYGYDS